MTRALLTAVERERIEQAVRAAEAKTVGEIVPMVVGASDDYPGARWRLATAFAFAVMAGLLLAWPSVDGLWLVAGWAPGLLLGHLLASRPALLRRALWRGKVDEEVRQRAIEAFVAHNLHATRYRTGVLLFVSLLERRIEVIGDVGINAKAPEGFWKGLVDALALRVRAGELAEGLVEAVGRCGELLELHFPRRQDDQNELDDHVVVEP
jgi:putative membrane protein